MSDIQRWGPAGKHWEMAGNDEGAWVTYADHVAAVAAAEQKVWDDAHKIGSDAYSQGQRDERERLAKDRTGRFALVRADERLSIRKAVEALNAERGYEMPSELYAETGDDYAEGWVDLLGLILAVIDGEQR
jgi:hypothetical protein